MREKHDGGRHDILALVIYVLQRTLCFATRRSTRKETGEDLAGALTSTGAY